MAIIWLLQFLDALFGCYLTVITKICSCLLFYIVQEESILKKETSLFHVILQTLAV